MHIGKLTTSDLRTHCIANLVLILLATACSSMAVASPSTDILFLASSSDTSPETGIAPTQNPSPEVPDSDVTSESTGEATPEATLEARADYGSINFMSDKGVEQKLWGIAGTFRVARIPYPTADKQVGDFVPLMFYKGENFFMRGLEGGVRIWYNKDWEFDIIGRYRYFDIPSDFQNLVRGGGIDAGARLAFFHDDELESHIELMSDDDGRLYSSLGLRKHFDVDAWDLIPYASLRLKSSEFNQRYYGLDGFIDPANGNTIQSDIGAGLDLTIGSEIRYHVASNFYLLGRAQFTALLDSDTRNSISIERQATPELFLGIAFFNDKRKPLKSRLQAKPYYRVSYAWATPSNMSQIIRFNWENDEQSNQMMSIFYGHPIADELFGWDPLDIYITSGYVRHFEADPYTNTINPGKGINTPEFAQIPQVPCDGINPCSITYQTQPANEFVVGIKAYVNITWPVHWRFGVAEGISYIDTVSNIEQREMDEKGYRSSNLMNYIDVTLDFSLGDAFNVAALRDTWFGIGIHHRSSIFETSSAFGRIKGGSNYNAIYIQQHF